MSLVDVAPILRITFAGIAFLLAFLAYRLLAKEIAKPEPRDNVLKSISTFMMFSFGLGLATIAAQTYEKYVLNTLPENYRAQLRSINGKIEAIESQTDNLKQDTSVAFIAKQIEDTNARIDGIALTAKPVADSPDYGCGGTQKNENTLTAMYGLRDGTSCGIPNRNFYREFNLVVPAKPAE